MSKPPMPEGLRVQAQAALKRLQKIPAVGTLNSEPTLEDGYLVSPWAAEDDNLWLYLMLEAVGTRSPAVANAFFQQIASLCPEVWNEEESVWKLDPLAFEQAVTIVRSMKPKNEAAACLAAQAVACHFAAMKLGNYMGQRDSIDPRTVASLALVAKTFAKQVETAEAMNGVGKKPARQVIKVEKHVHVHQHDERHLHLHGEGGGKSGGQPEATEPLRAHARPAGRVVEMSALRSENEGGNVLPIPCRQGPEAVPNAWLRPESGWAEGEGERELPARGLDSGSGRPAPGSRSAA